MLLTGEPLPTAQIRDNKDFPGAEGQWPLEAGTRTLAGYLQSAGYGTGGFGKWAWATPETPATRTGSVSTSSTGTTASAWRTATSRRT
ncbi:MAG: hypothetical protein R3F17_12345 [Planctomycetota bacterium]